MYSTGSLGVNGDIIAEYRLEEDNRLIKPAFGTGSIADIPGLLKRNLGVSARRPLPSLFTNHSMEVDHQVFFLLDGFGSTTVDYVLSRNGNKHLKGFLDESAYLPITSVFPSTTSTATVTYQTDQTPLEHGIIGYNAYLSEIGAVCNMLTLAPVGRSDYSLLDHGWSLPGLENNKTIYEDLKEDDADTFLYLPNGIKGSGLTKITSRGSSVRGYISISQMLATLRRDLEHTRGKSFHFCYVPNIDTISHKLGPYTEETALETESIFQMINEQFLDRIKLSGSLNLSISADHGHTVIDHENVFDVRRDETLSSLLRSPVLGDMRAPILRIMPGMFDRAMNHLETEYARDYIVKSGEAMIREGFYGSGEICTSNLDRFGDIVLIPKKSVGMFDSSLGVLDQKLNTFDLVGMHGGLSFEEMVVPLLTRTVEGKK